MFETRSQRNWTITALIIFALSFIAISIISRRPLCLDSRLIDKVERIDGKRVFSLYRCAARKSVPYDDVLAADVFSLSRRLHDLERYFESLRTLQQPVTIKIVEKNLKHFRIMGNELQISRDLFESDGYLEKAVLKMWVREQMSSENPVFEESFSDFLYFAMNGSLQLGSENLAESPEYQESKWPFVAKGLRSYCESGWKSVEHVWFCSQEIKTHGKSFVPLSIRPLLTSALIESYLAMKFKERAQLFSALPGLLSGLDPRTMGRGYSALESSQQDLVDLSTEITSFIQALEDFGTRQTVLNDWNMRIKKHLELKGFTNEPLEAQVDVLLHVSLKKPLPLIEAVGLTKKRGLTVLASTGDDYIFLPGLEPIPQKAIRAVRAQRVIYWTCEAPSLKELMRYADVSTRLLLIEDCGETPSLSLASSLAKGIESFMKENPKIAFVDFHLPSLHYALESQKLESSTQILIASLTSVEMQKTLHRQLGWREQSFDKALNFYQVESDIEAIRAFRP